MDQNIRASLQTAALYNFLIIVFITMVSQSITLMAIIFAINQDQLKKMQLFFGKDM